uniref:Histone-lysine N-methyltransferase SETD2 n=1 Tax=Schistosoma haematobium TaxID=6185 RepID=A0A095A7X0_SCHHA
MRVSEQKCYCGASTCSGVMGATSKYLQEKVRMKDTTMVERRILQLLQLDSFRNADDITLLLQVMVQECLTRYTRLQLLSRLIKTENDACLKLFRQYNGLDMLAAFMCDAAPKDWELKKQILVCLKHIPVSEQKQVQSNSRLMEIVAQWTSNPHHCRARSIPLESWKSADVHIAVSKSTKDNESSSIQTGDKNSDFAASPSSSDSFSSSLKENASCVLHASTLPVYEEGFDAITQTSDCDMSPVTVVDDDNGEIEIGYAADNNEINMDTEECKAKTNEEWIEEIKALACKLLEKWSKLPNGPKASNSSSCLSKAERRMLFEAQVKANENQCSSENSVPTSDDFVQTNPSNDEKDTDHLRQLLLCALLSECGRNDTALSNLLSNIAVELKSMPVVSTLLQALPRMLTLMSSSNDSDLVTRLCKELKRYADDDLNSLPAGWRSAADSSGRLYYYNKETNSVQWEKPLINSNEKDDKNTLTEEQYGQMKRQFTHEVGNYILRLLKPYRLPNCLTGRIDSSEDFVHITKKLTHSFVSKELKRSSLTSPPTFSNGLQERIRLSAVYV